MDRKEVVVSLWEACDGIIDGDRVEVLAMG